MTTRQTLSVQTRPVVISLIDITLLLIASVVGLNSLRHLPIGWLYTPCAIVAIVTILRLVGRWVPPAKERPAGARSIGADVARVVLSTTMILGGAVLAYLSLRFGYFHIEPYLISLALIVGGFAILTT